MVAIDGKSRMAVEMVLEDLATKDLKRFGGQVKRTARGATGDFNRLDKSVGKVGRRIAGLAAGFLALRGAVAGVRRSVGAGFGFVDASADFEESVSKFGVVFGDFAQETARELDQLADAVGRPRTELIDFASTFQDTLVPMGLVREEAAGLSVDLTALAIDAASFNNKLDADAVRDFQSALVGNTETVRKYGIVINVTNTAAEAYRLGLVKQGEEVTEVAKIQARMSLIQQGLTDAQGDAERTANSYQNTMKRLRGEVEEQRVVFGQLIQQEILDAIEEMGGLDVVVGHVRVGFGFLTGVTRRFIEAGTDMAIVARDVIDQLGGADAVARGLAGNFLKMSTLGDVWVIVWSRAARATGEIFGGIEESVEILIGRILHKLRFDFGKELALLTVEMQQQILKSAEGSVIGQALGIEALSDQQEKATKKAIARAFDLAAAQTQAARSYEQVWSESLEGVNSEFIGTFNDIQLLMRRVGEEGLDFDFKLEDVFKPEEVEGAAEEMGRRSGSAFINAFDTAVAVGFGEVLAAGVRDGVDKSESKNEDAGSALGQTVGSAFGSAFKQAVGAVMAGVEAEIRSRQNTFAAGFASAWEEIASGLTDRSLGRELAFETFGALESGLEKFSQDLIEGKAQFRDFTKSLIKDIAAIATKILLLRAIRGIIPGLDSGGGKPSFAIPFAEGGVMPGSMGSPMPVKAYAQGGIADTPQVAVFGEGRGAEAFVPLGGDRKIPVRMEGSGSGSMQVTVNLNTTSLDPRSAADVILEQFPLLEKKLAASLRSGRNRGLVSAVRSTANGGR